MPFDFEINGKGGSGEPGDPTPEEIRDAICVIVQALSVSGAGVPPVGYHSIGVIIAIEATEIGFSPKAVIGNEWVPFTPGKRTEH